MGRFKEGIARIKSGLAKNIFRQELTEIYRQQTQHWDALVRQSGEVMKELIRQMLSGMLENPRVSSAYDLWYQLREEVLRTYRNDLPDRGGSIPTAM